MQIINNQQKKNDCKLKDFLKKVTLRYKTTLLKDFIIAVLRDVMSYIRR